MSEKLDGVIHIHSHNHTSFSRVAWAPFLAYKNIPELEFNPSLPYNEYNYLNPGVYKVQINGTMYVFLVHDELLRNGDRLIIKNEYDIFEFDNSVRKDIIPYKINDGLKVTQYGHELKNTLNDMLDVLIMEGVTIYKKPRSFIRPGSFNHLNNLNIRIRNRHGEYTDQTFHSPIALKSIGHPHRPKTYACDILYLDSYKQKALYEIRLGTMQLTGFNSYRVMDEYNNGECAVIYIPSANVCLNSKLNCTHLNTIPLSELISSSTTNNCIASGIDESTQGLWIKINKSIFGDNLIEFKTKMENMSSQGNGITILYELTNPLFEHILLDDYKIKIPFGHCYVMPTPTNMVYKVDAIYNDEYRDQLNAKSDDGEYIENVKFTEPYLVEPNVYMGPYDAELNNGEYWEQVYFTADINTRLIYFYKTLALGL